MDAILAQGLWYGWVGICKFPLKAAGPPVPVIDHEYAFERVRIPSDLPLRGILILKFHPSTTQILMLFLAKVLEAWLLGAAGLLSCRAEVGLGT